MLLKINLVFIRLYKNGKKNANPIKNLKNAAWAGGTEGPTILTKTVTATKQKPERTIHPRPFIPELLKLVKIVVIFFDTKSIQKPIFFAKLTKETLRLKQIYFLLKNTFSLAKNALRAL